MKVIKNKTRGSAILMTIFLLFGILVISTIGLEIIMSGLTARRAQGASTKALFAAETGIERATMAFKTNKDLLTDCLALTDANGYLSFCSDNGTTCEGTETVSCLALDDANKKIYYLKNINDLPAYWVKVTITKAEDETEYRMVNLNARGNYAGTSRELYVRFCLPDCDGKGAGESDGCGGDCK